MLKSELLIRLATNADVTALVELAATTFRDTYQLLSDPQDLDDYIQTHFTQTILASTVMDAASTVLVAQNGDRLVGYAHIRKSKVPVCVTGPAPIELVRLYLRQDSIGKRYGIALMQAVIDVARRNDCVTLWLSVYDRNVRAVEFYKRWGFVDVGTKEFVFGGTTYDDPIMVVSVSSIGTP